MMCKVCDAEMPDWICRNCYSYEIYSAANSHQSEFIVVGNLELTVRDDNAILWIKNRKFQVIVMPELTPQLAKKWFNKMKALSLLS